MGFRMGLVIWDKLSTEKPQSNMAVVRQMDYFNMFKNLIQEDSFADFFRYYI
jgi:hypothetical protein